MNNISASGVELSIIELKKNKLLTCDTDCWALDRCDFKRAVGLNPTNSKFLATVITLNAKNFSATGWPIELGNWELIDTDGFAYRAHNMCQSLLPPRVFQAGHWTVSPGTQVNFMLVFPELEDGKDVAKILYVSNGEISSFEVNELKGEVIELFETRQRAVKMESIENDYELRQLRDDIDRLDATIFVTGHEKISINGHEKSSTCKW